MQQIFADSLIYIEKFSHLLATGGITSNNFF